MLEVHPPERTPHTWRDFFIHIATIVVGLVIAVGLEQTVEAIHHRHERSELRETLHRESEQILKDSRNTSAALDFHQDWLGRRVDQVKAAVWQQLPLGEPAAYARPAFDYPDNPLWRSAKIGGLVERLGPDELNAYSEVELLSGKIDVFYDDWRQSQSKRLQLERQYPRHSLDSADFTKASPQDLRAYLGLLTAEAESTKILQEWDRNIQGAEETILNGELRLEAILAAEKKSSCLASELAKDVTDRRRHSKDWTMTRSPAPCNVRVCSAAVWSIDIQGGNRDGSA
jgi:hypothetical protein